MLNLPTSQMKFILEGMNSCIYGQNEVPVWADKDYRYNEFYTYLNGFSESRRPYNACNLVNDVFSESLTIDILFNSLLVVAKLLVLSITLTRPRRRHKWSCVCS